MSSEIHPLLVDMFDAAAFASFDKQAHLASIHGEHDWGLAMDAGLLTFDNQHDYECQILGTQSEVSNSWRWGWANTSGIPDEMLHATLQLRELGAKQQIPELTESDLELEAFDSDYLAMLASSLCQAKAYYRGGYEGGAVYLLITDQRFPANERDPITRIRSLVPQAIMQLSISNHKKAYESYLKYLGKTGEADGSSIVMRHESAVLRATFDDLNRLTTLEVKG